jgi:hypothetical protein
MNKLRKKGVLIALVFGLTALSFGLFPVPKAFAASQCYSQSPKVPGYNPMDCGDLAKVGIQFNFTAPCYKVPFSGGGYPGTPIETPCAELTGQTPPRCFDLKEIDTNGKKTMVTTENYCDANFQKALTANQLGTPQPNTCYITNKKNGQTGKIDCKQADDQKFYSAIAITENQNQNQGPTDPGSTGTGDGTEDLGAPAEVTDDPIDNATGGTGKCGDGSNSVGTTVDLGCSGTGNPLNDLLFAAIRFLVAGVGVVVIASIVVGGIQYTSSQGEPQKQKAARERVINALIALLVYLLTFALVQWLVPGGIF